MAELRIHIQPVGYRPIPVNEERCEFSGKRCFNTRDDAEAQAAEWAHINGFRGSVYWCKPVRGAHWHLTREVI